MAVVFPSDSDWKDCIEHHFRFGADDSPSAVSYQVVVDRFDDMVKDFLRRVRERARDPRMYDCLKLAATTQVCPEFEHEQVTEKCIFSGRTQPMEISVSGSSRTVIPFRRLHCCFTWWAQHPETGLDCPHFSSFFVYESRFSYIIKGMHVLGHFDAMLRSVALEMKDLAHDEFVSDPRWSRLRDNLNAIVSMLVTELVPK